MKAPLRVFIAALSILLLAQAPPVTNADLDRIRNEIARLKQRLEDVHRRTQSAQQELEAADLELGIQSRELELATETRQRVDTERLQLEAQIRDLVIRVGHQKEQLRKRLVALYRLGGLSYVRILISLDARNDPMGAISMLSFLVAHDARTIARFQVAHQQLDARRGELAARQQQLVQLEQFIEQRRRAVAAAYNEKQRILAALQAQETGSEQKIAELEEKERRLERLVEILSKQSAGILPSADIRSYRGTLAWPAEGSVVESFGRQRNVKFSTYTMNNGLRIAAAPRTPVRAVFQGTVLFSQWFKGYGNLIILDHGNRVVSLYGNVIAPAVSVGDRVSTGQAIAGVGESEDAGGGSLYFEIRQDNRPEDPREWLR